eukprot:NODE_1621_length_1100_cov_243.519617.p1 GENE.NODE_1621_length_1100_cov_243.519617~~NODE_1621_length_1100_cov_243.519617.p1  ORF type:complete len:289 (+),score=65.76 NODE_1621_length_1100_cov_243.519617:3-869(+)
MGALCAQMICLAKYWLLNAVALEMITELLQSVKKDDVPILEDVAKAFDLPELSAATEKLRKAALCSLGELTTMVRQALKGGKQAQSFCTAALEGHPEAAAVLRAQLGSCSDFFVWGERDKYSCGIRKTVQGVRVVIGFRWFWSEVEKAKLLKSDLPFITMMLIQKLNSNTGYTMNQHHGNDHDTTPSTLITALQASLDGDQLVLIEDFRNMIDAAAELLRTRHLLPADLKEMFTSLPRSLLSYCDANLAKLITSLPVATGIDVFQLMRGRIGDVGSETAAALRNIVTT